MFSICRSVFTVLLKTIIKIAIIKLLLSSLKSSVTMEIDCCFSESLTKRNLSLNFSYFLRQRYLYFNRTLIFTLETILLCPMWLGGGIAEIREQTCCGEVGTDDRSDYRPCIQDCQILKRWYFVSVVVSYKNENIRGR